MKVIFISNMKIKSTFITTYDLIVAVYIIFALWLSYIYDFSINFKLISHFQYDLIFISIALLNLVIYAALLALKIRRSNRDIFLFGKTWRHEISEKYFKYEKLLNLIKIVILLKITLLIFCNLKQAIPIINPKLFDIELLAIDKVIHFGVNPNIFIVKLLGNDFIAALFDRLYIFWYIIKPLILVYFAIIANKNSQIRFFTSYFLMWIIGGLSALIIPSLGPIYTHPEWFASLNIPFARNLQSMLWKHYEIIINTPGKYKVFIYEGIAAFPSLHVGVVAIFAFYLWEVNKKIGIVIFAYLAIILFGSVLLGWHYAVDGYFAILLAYILFLIPNKE